MADAIVPLRQDSVRFLSVLRFHAPGGEYTIRGSDGLMSIKEVTASVDSELCGDGEDDGDGEDEEDEGERVDRGIVVR